MSLVPDLQVLLAFTLAAVVLIVTPGPDMALFLGQTLTAGRTRGFAAMLGVITGAVLHSLIAAFGLSALLAASVLAFTALKIAGLASRWARCVTDRHSPCATSPPAAGRSVRLI